MWGNITIAFLLAFITSFVITPYTMRLAHRVGAMDLPEERKIHKKPIPRLGGLAIITGFLLSVLYCSEQIQPDLLQYESLHGV